MLVSLNRPFGLRLLIILDYGAGLAQLPSLPSSPPAPAKSGAPQGFGGHPVLEVRYGEPTIGKAQTQQGPRGELLHRKLQDYICNDYSWALNTTLSFQKLKEDELE